jgi:hypothetical protein
VGVGTVWGEGGTLEAGGVPEGNRRGETFLLIFLNHVRSKVFGNACANPSRIFCQRRYSNKTTKRDTSRSLHTVNRNNSHLLAWARGARNECRTLTESGAHVVYSMVQFSLVCEHHLPQVGSHQYFSTIYRYLRLNTGGSQRDLNPDFLISLSTRSMTMSY